MFSFVLNAPYTFIGLLTGLISLPKSISFRNNPYAIIVRVKSFWWHFGYAKKARAATIGQAILLSPQTEKNDLKHELIHVKQYERLPMLFPFFYHIEYIKKRYKYNKYENEAYKLSGSVYRGR